MTPRTFARLLAAYAVLVVVVMFAVRSHVTLKDVDGPVVESQWKQGKRIARRVHPAAEPATKPAPGVTVVEEHVVGEAPLAHDGPFLIYGLVSGRDGVRADLDGKTAYATVDDLVYAQAYDHAGALFDPSLGVGVHRATLMHVLAEALELKDEKDVERAQLTRVRFERRTPAASPRVYEEALTPTLVRARVREAASYLARHVQPDGRFDYIVVATTGAPLLGYSWPRHAGATYFLAQAAALLDDPTIRYAALRAAAFMRDVGTIDCGANRCVGNGDDVDVGSSALAVVAYSELVLTQADAAYRGPLKDLLEFLRGQQRADGELMHLYRRSTKQPIDVQYLYYTGETALAFARAHRVTEDPRDLEASKKALAHLVGPGWSFFGSRYFFSEEHWTCQTMSDLWERAPNEEALAFCLRWHQYQRALQYQGGDSPFDAKGAFGFGPFIAPRLTPASSRGEAAGATLEVARKKSELGEESKALADELAQAIAFVLREQFSPGPSWLFASPEAVRGAMPGSPVDWQLRIDYEQHAGSMLIRWLTLNSR